MVPQREAIGPVVRFNIWFRKAPSTLPKELAGNPPEASDKIPISFNDWRAETQATREAAAYQALLDGYDIRIAKP